MDTKKYYNIFSILLGFIYILFILWLRLIRERLPKDIYQDFNSYIFYIYLLFLILSICMFIYYLRKILNIQSKYKLLSKILEIPFIFNITAFFTEYILNAPYNCYLWIYNKINLLPIVEKLGAHIWNRDPYKDPQNIVIFLCILKLIISLCFITDIVLFHKFNYFYKSLILLFVILLCNCFIFILKDISQYNKTYISENYITIENHPDKVAFIADFQPHFKGERGDDRLYVHYRVWICYLANCMFTDKFYEYYHKYNNYTSVIYYGIFSLGWGYILL